MSTQAAGTSEWVPFGDVARGRLDEQCQYAARYVDGSLSFPYLGHGLRFQGVPSDYHSLVIHEQDIDEFVRRALTWRAGFAHDG